MIISIDAITDVKTYFLALQQRLIDTFEAMDGKARFVRDQWQRPSGGGGLTCALSDGLVFEKAGVNFSHVFGDELPQTASAHRKNLADYAFDACGVSLVMHPQNPFVPTMHANVRFFIAHAPDKPAHWWFGGGFDLTPYYGFVEDCQHWHQTAKAACDPYGTSLYPRFKQWCDTYFYLKHRGEARGVGGLFFDDLQLESFENTFSFVQSIGDNILAGYVPIVARRQHLAYSEAQKAFQLHRRGRYVEFNLLYDRGTLFGLESGGRTESILMSMPPIVRWTYDYKPLPNTPEAALYTDFLPARDWLG